jgi:hypothetical protein
MSGSPPPTVDSTIGSRVAVIGKTIGSVIFNQFPLKLQL